MSAEIPLLQVRGLKVRRGARPVLDIPELSIFPEEIISLIGPNGAGKTTFLHALMRLIKTDDGEILYEGNSVPAGSSLHAYRRNFALVMQEPMLFNTTVYGNIAAGLKIRGLRRKEIDMIVRAQLERFGISHLEKRNSLEISGGEAQRTSLARAFAVGPRVILLDEPFTSLDVPTRETLIDDLEKVLHETSTTAVFATHDRSEAIRLSDRIAVMNEGKVLQIDPPGTIMQRPADEFVASFVGTETILNGEVTGAGQGTFLAAVSGREIEILGDAVPGERVTIGIRPENIVLSTGSPGTTSARNSFAGSITKIVRMGAYYKIFIDCGFPLISYVTGHSIENLMLGEGKEVTASFKATSIHIVRRN